MRILRKTTLRLAHRCLPQCSQHSRLHVFALQSWLVSANGFVNLGADAHDGIQRSHRLLKNHRDLLPANRAPFRLG